MSKSAKRVNRPFPTIAPYPDTKPKPYIKKREEEVYACMTCRRLWEMVRGSAWCPKTKKQYHTKFPLKSGSGCVLYGRTQKICPDCAEELIQKCWDEAHQQNLEFNRRRKT